MTFRPSPLSTRAAAAAQFGTTLDLAMKRRRVGRNQLAKHLGMTSASIIAWWRAGNGLPRLDNAKALAEALDCPELLSIVHQAAKANCEHCGGQFTHTGNGPRRYCSEKCRDAKGKVAAFRRNHADAISRQLANHEAAVADFCAACQPNGLCQNPRCQLRPVSPLPYVSPRDGTRDPGLAIASPMARTATLGRRPT